MFSNNLLWPVSWFNTILLSNSRIFHPYSHRPWPSDVNNVRQMKNISLFSICRLQRLSTISL